MEVRKRSKQEEDILCFERVGLNILFLCQLRILQMNLFAVWWIKACSETQIQISMFLITEWSRTSLLTFSDFLEPHFGESLNS